MASSDSDWVDGLFTEQADEVAIYSQLSMSQAPPLLQPPASQLHQPNPPQPAPLQMPVATATEMPVATVREMPVATATEMPVATATEMPVATATEMPVATATCWGMALKAACGDSTPCDSGFVPGKAHLKNKFCHTCRKGMVVPVTHVRALTPEQLQGLTNGKRSGVWSSAPLEPFGVAVDYRLLNHTKGCRGVPLALFREPPPGTLELGLPPSHWLSPDQDTMQIVVAHGTLVPTRELTQAYGTQLQDKADEARAHLVQQQQHYHQLMPSPQQMMPTSLQMHAPVQMPQHMLLHHHPMLQQAPLSGAVMMPTVMLPAGASAVDSGSNSDSSSCGGKRPASNASVPAVQALKRLASGAVSSSSNGSDDSHHVTHQHPSQLLLVDAPRASVFSSFLPSTFGTSSAVPASSSCTPQLGEEQTDPRIEIDALLPPTPPMSPPDPVTLAAASGLRKTQPPTRETIHPLTLLFSSDAVEAEWRHAHASMLFSTACVVLPIGPAIYTALALKEANQGARIWLQAWAVGWTPASLLLLWLRARHGDQLPPRAPRVLDWAAASLCVLPQLFLTIVTSRGVQQPLDPLDPAGGVETFGKLLANWVFACLFLQINATHPLLKLLAAVTTTALMCYQLPISLTPDLEFIMCRKGIAGGMVGGYVLEHSLRTNYLHSRQHDQSRRQDKQQTSQSAAPLAVRAEGSASAANGTGAAETKCGRTGATGMKSAPADFEGTSTSISRLYRDPLTLRFSSLVMEAQYRHELFEESLRWLSCVDGLLVAMQLQSYVEGQAELRESLILVGSQNFPRLVRLLVHTRGDSRATARRYRLFFWLYTLCLLVVKLYLPLQSSSGAAAGDTSTESWLLLQAFFMRLQGPDAHFSWLMSALAIVLSYVAPAWTWRGDQEADATALRHTAIAGEVLAYVFDWALRTSFSRRLQRASSDVEQPAAVAS